MLKKEVNHCRHRIIIFRVTLILHQLSIVYLYNLIDTFFTNALRLVLCMFSQPPYH